MTRRGKWTIWTTISIGVVLSVGVVICATREKPWSEQLSEHYNNLISEYDHAAKIVVDDSNITADPDATSVNLSMERNMHPIDLTVAMPKTHKAWEMSTTPNWFVALQSGPKEIPDVIVTLDYAGDEFLHIWELAEGAIVGVLGKKTQVEVNASGQVTLRLKSDEEQFRYFLGVTKSDLVAAKTDHDKTVVCFSGLWVHSDLRVGKDVTLCGHRNHIYVDRRDKEKRHVLWLFDGKGHYVGRIEATPQYLKEALQIAESVTLSTR